MTPARSASNRRGRWPLALLTGVLAVAWILVTARLLGIRGPLFALSFHFALMGAADLCDRLLAPRLSSRRFRVAPQEVELYRRLGVGRFMHFLRRIGWTAAVRQPGMFDGTRRTLAGYELATRHGENNHLWLLAVSGVPIVLALSRGWWDAVFWLGSSSVLFHLYPVMLQRSQRARLTALLERTAAREGRSGTDRRD